MSVPTGPELGTSPVDGSLRFRNVRPGAWPGAGAGCLQSEASDLRNDGDLGLWVPPAGLFTTSLVQDSGQTDIGVGFGSWFLNSASLLPLQDLAEALVCSGQQVQIGVVFTVNALIPQNSGLAWTLGASSQPPPAMPPASTYLEHGRMQGWADSAAPTGTVYTMARTDTLSRYVYVPQTPAGPVPATEVGVFPWQAFTGIQASGTTPATPTITRMLIEVVAVGWNAPTGFTSPEL